MQLAFKLIAVAAVVAAVPLFSLTIPYFTFLAIIDDLPLEFAHPHIQETGYDILGATITAFCIPWPFYIIHFVCASSSPSNIPYSIDDLTFAQRVLYAEMTRLSPTTEAFHAITKIVDTTELALAMDDHVLLAEDGLPGVHGVGDISLLIELGQTSRSVSLHVYRLLAHVELALMR